MKAADIRLLEILIRAYETGVPLGGKVSLPASGPHRESILARINQVRTDAGDSPLGEGEECPVMDLINSARDVLIETVRTR